MTLVIELVESDDAVRACVQVLAALHSDRVAFDRVADDRVAFDRVSDDRVADGPAADGSVAERLTARIARQRLAGYRLVSARLDGEVVAVAGFVLAESLARGRHLRIEDLVTAPAQRRRGHGTALLAWLRTFAAAQGCSALHVEAGPDAAAAAAFLADAGLSAGARDFGGRLDGAYGTNRRSAGGRAPMMAPSAREMFARRFGIDTADGGGSVDGAERTGPDAGRVPGPAPAPGADRGADPGAERDEDEFDDPSHDGGLDPDFRDA